MKDFIEWPKRTLLQTILVVLLGLIYFFGVGITKVFILLTRRDYLFSKKPNDTNWLIAEGYAPTLQEAEEQS